MGDFRTSCPRCGASEEKACLEVVLLRLAGKTSEARDVIQAANEELKMEKMATEAIKALPDSYKQASKVAFGSSEQKATDALVKLVGGESRANELMNIWQSVQGLTKPLYGTTLERLYGTGKVSPVKNFIVKARNNRFSDAAIKHYVEQIQKEKVPTDWKKLKKEAN